MASRHESAQQLGYYHGIILVVALPLTAVIAVERFRLNPYSTDAAYQSSLNDRLHPFPPAPAISVE